MEPQQNARILSVTVRVRNERARNEHQIALQHVAEVQLVQVLQAHSVVRDASHGHEAPDQRHIENPDTQSVTEKLRHTVKVSAMDNQNI